MPERADRSPLVLRRAALVTCVALPIVFGAIALAAARTKSATMDEPLHAVGAFAHVFHRDFRINPEDPPLWNYWAMLPHGRASLRIDTDDPDWIASLRNPEHQTRVTTRTLYQTSGNDGIAFVNRTRAMMAGFGVVLGWIIALWAWRLAGPVAAVVATGLYSLDPNFLAHAPLVKNDVPIALLLAGVALLAWSAGKRVTWWNLPLLGLLGGAALATKYSGVIVIPIVAILMLARAILPHPWPILRMHVSGIAGKLATAAGACALCAALGVFVIWLSYGFRYDPTPTPGARMDIDFEAKAAVQNHFFAEHGRFATNEEYAKLRPPPLVRAALFADRRGLLPHAYLHGFLMTYQSSIVRSAYLMGTVSPTGWWYYFPLAMLFKTPIATLLAIALAVIGAIVLLIKRRPIATPWSMLALLVPAIVYGGVAMSSDLNLGLRHILPVYPFLFILAGVIASRCADLRPRVTSIIAGVLLVGVAVESLLAYPHFIPFFNAIFARDRVTLLSDSNLDWGQDLPLLAEWRRDNPAAPLYLCYFGSVDPAAHGIADYVNLPGGFWLGPPYQWPDPSRPGVIAISATYLQGNHIQAELRNYYAPLRDLRPREILGGSIYLYDFPPARTENVR